MPVELEDIIQRAIASIERDEELLALIDRLVDRSAALERRVAELEAALPALTNRIEAAMRGDHGDHSRQV